MQKFKCLLFVQIGTSCDCNVDCVKFLYDISYIVLCPALDKIRYSQLAISEKHIS